MKCETPGERRFSRRKAVLVLCLWSVAGAHVSAGSLAATKHQLYADWHRSVADSVRDAQERLEVMMTEPDFAEGVAAFTERRPPSF